ncbi:MAG: hypothetical protein IJR86_08165 [Bacteroidaceae bacterium]|nr:hypothetical protein [Bacteroidaceae bacterium]
MRGFEELSAAVSDAKLAYMCGHPEMIAPIERSRLAHANWVRLPSVCTPIAKEDVLEWRGNLLVGAFLSRQEDRYLRACGFRKAMTNESAVLWCRDNRTLHWQMEDVRLALNLDDKLCRLGEPSVLSTEEPLESDYCNTAAQGKNGLSGSVEDGVVRAKTCDSVFLVAFMAAMLLVVSWLGRLSWSFGRGRRAAVGVLVLAYFILMTAIALRVGFTPPNGLAVYAGKAKLLYAEHGIPFGFWTQADYSIFQPGYPPLQTLLALCLRCLGADVVMLFLMPIVMTSLFVVLLRLAGSDLLTMRTLLVVAYVMAPMSFRLTAGYYAEPLAAFMLICGFACAIKERLLLGAVIMGLAGLVRLEGVVIAPLAVLLCLSHRRMLVAGFADCAKNLAAVALSIFPGGLWLMLICCLGCKLQGFSIAGAFDCGQSLAVARSSLSILSLDLAETGLPLDMCLIMLLSRKASRFAVLMIPLGLYLCTSVAAVAAGMGLHSAGDVQWMLETWLPRYLWLSISIPIAVCLMHGTVEGPRRAHNLWCFRRFSLRNFLAGRHKDVFARDLKSYCAGQS